MRLARRITALAAGTTLVAGTLLAAAPAANALTPSETGSFLGALTATYNDPVSTPNDGNPYDYDILTKAVLVTGADATLASLPSFTLFAPNDRAFEVLANKLGLLGLEPPLRRHGRREGGDPRPGLPRSAPTRSARCSSTTCSSAPR